MLFFSFNWVSVVIAFSRLNKNLGVCFHTWLIAFFCYSARRSCCSAGCIPICINKLLLSRSEKNEAVSNSSKYITFALIFSLKRKVFEPNAFEDEIGRDNKQMVLIPFALSARPLLAVYKLWVCFDYLYIKMEK